MTPTPSPQGMVDHLDGVGAPTAEEMAFGRAFVTPGPVDPAVLAILPDVEARAARIAVRQATDWAQLGRYRDANAALAGQPVKAVLMGDSITEAWPLADPDLFTGGIVGRGISGQTSPQMLVRLMPDAVALAPKVIHLMCGLNDIAGNTGPTTPTDYKNTVTAMATIVRSHGVRLILGSLTPAARFAWNPDLPDPRPRIRELNAWLRTFATAEGAVFADYHAVISTSDWALRPDLTRDEVHPLKPAYDLMRPVLDAALLQALRY